MKTGTTLAALAQELYRQIGSKKDMIVPSTLMSFSTTGSGNVLAIEEDVGPTPYRVTDLARRQLAEKLRIPVSYFERMREEQPALLDHTVNTWLQADPERRLVRTLDGKVRAILSDRYRRLDNVDLAEHVLPVLQKLPGARFESLELTETHLYLKVVTGLSVEVFPGDVVQAGVVISNSEVGQGSLCVQPLVYRLLCSNGLIVPDYNLRKTHIGRSMTALEDAVTVYSDETLLADDRAFFLKVRDVIDAAVSETTFAAIARRLQTTRSIRLTGDPAKTVEVLAERYVLTEQERGGVLRHLVEGGDLSGYGLVNALTHYSQTVEDYERATDFEVLGGKLIDLPGRAWVELAEAV